MAEIRLKERLPVRCFAWVVDCELCGVECTDQPIYIIEDSTFHWPSGNYCLECLGQIKPDWVEVV